MNSPRNESGAIHADAIRWVCFWQRSPVSVVFVAITGLFVLKGKNGITGRGWWLTIIGIVVPTVYWIWYQYF